jgi:hypothetical protein
VARLSSIRLIPAMGRLEGSVGWQLESGRQNLKQLMEKGVSRRIRATHPARSCDSGSGSCAPL